MLFTVLHDNVYCKEKIASVPLWWLPSSGFESDHTKLAVVAIEVDVVVECFQLGHRNVCANIPQTSIFIDTMQTIIHARFTYNKGWKATIIAQIIQKFLT